VLVLGPEPAKADNPVDPFHNSSQRAFLIQTVLLSMRTRSTPSKPAVRGSMKPRHAHSILLLRAHLCYVSVQAASNFTRFRSSANRSSVLVQPEMERSSVSTSGCAVIPEECERCSGPSMQLASGGTCALADSHHRRFGRCERSPAHVWTHLQSNP
jgi:hypothetical protein